MTCMGGSLRPPSSSLASPTRLFATSAHRCSCFPSLQYSPIVRPAYASQSRGGPAAAPRASCSYMAAEPLIAGRGVPLTRSLPSTVRKARHHRHPSRRQILVRAAADFYDTLGVSRSADKAEIKKAYRQQARKFHPDVNKDPGADEQFKAVSNAYEVLSDDQKRPIYDKYGEAGLKGMGGGAGGPAGDPFGNPFDIFEQFFGGGSGFGGFGGGGGRQRSQPRQGEDMRYDLQLEFNEAIFGTSKELDVTRLEACSSCDNSGVQKGTTSRSCNTCGGSGQVVSTMRTPMGAFQQVTSCPNCEGQGEESTPCSTCGGDGRVRKSKRIQLRVPPGVDTNSRLRVKSEGNAGRKSGPAGDLYAFITVREHNELKRDGTTIHSNIDVSYVDAILGTTVKVQTVDGQVDLKIPSGTQPGTTLVMGKRGVPRLGTTTNTTRGDHNVHVRVNIPTRPSKDEIQLVEKLREAQVESAKRPRIGKWQF